MTERIATYQAGEYATDFAKLIVDDPHLYELLNRAKDAFNDLAVYMVEKCRVAGVEMSDEWRDLAASVEKRCVTETRDGRAASGGG